LVHPAPWWVSKPKHSGKDRNKVRVITTIPFHLKIMSSLQTVGKKFLLLSITNVLPTYKCPTSASQSKY